MKIQQKMSYKKCSDAVQKNSAIWSRNLLSFEKSAKKRKEFPVVQQSLGNKCKMPKESDIIGRFLYLSKTWKSKAERYKIIRNEIEELWSKFDFQL